VHSGVLYTHNDSAGSARLFAMTDAAELRGELMLVGASAKDWEAVAVGPCPSGTCVFLADVGDNGLVRDDYALYRIPEPPVLPEPAAVLTAAPERYPLIYPDGRHNAETLLVHPATGETVIVTKGAVAEVYEVPPDRQPDRPATLARIGVLSLPAEAGPVTDGSVHPCANRVLIRTERAAFELALPAGAPLAASLVAGIAMPVPLGLEPQGEAVAYAADGGRYFTASETLSGGPVPQLSMVECAGGGAGGSP
jgi:hypothetical protein